MADLFQLFRSKQLKPVWEFHSEALIWRIIATPLNTIVGEARNQSAKTTSYFCVDAQTGRPLWMNRSFDELWWIGIETVHENRLILHGFTRPDIPEHRGIRIVDLATGALVWMNNDIAFWFVHEKNIYAYKYVFDKRIGYELDIESGEVLGEFVENLDQLHELRRNVLQFENKIQEGLLYPEISSKSGDGSELERLIEKVTREHSVEGWTEYLLSRHILVVSYYQKESSAASTTFQNILVVYDVRGKESVFHEIIAKGVQAPSSDTFFVKNDSIYFIKSQKTLSVLRPWGL